MPVSQQEMEDHFSFLWTWAGLFIGFDQENAGK